MIGEILGKALLVVKADTSQAKAEIKELSREEQKAAKERLKAQEEVNEGWDRALKKHALVVAGVSAGVAIAIASVKKYQEHLREMGDTGSSEFERVQRASEAATKAQDNLMIAIGRLAAEAAPAVEALAAMALEIGNIVDGVGRLIRGATSLIPGGSGAASFAGKWAGRGAFGLAGVGYGLYSDYLATPDQYQANTNMTSAELSAYYGGTADGTGDDQMAFESAPPPSQARRKGWVHVSGDGYDYWRPPNAKEKAEQEKRRKAGATQADKYNDAWLKIKDSVNFGSGVTAPNYDNSDEELWRSMFGNVDDEAANFGAWDFLNEGKGKGSLWQSVAPPQSLLDQLDEMERGLQQSMLAKIFGPIEEFDLYRTAWQGLEAVVTAGFDAWISGSKSAGQAMKEALHQYSKQLAGEAVLQALRHGAYALGSLAFGDVRAAQAHGISAAKWTAVAAAATILGKTTAPSAAGGSSGYAAAGIGGGPRGGGGGTTSTTVVLGDGFNDTSPRYVARRTRRAMDLANHYAAYGGSHDG